MSIARRALCAALSFAFAVAPVADAAAFGLGRLGARFGKLGGIGPRAKLAAPGDIISGWSAFYSMRTFSAATKGTKAINVCNVGDAACVVDQAGTTESTTLSSASAIAIGTDTVGDHGDMSVMESGVLPVALTTQQRQSLGANQSAYLNQGNPYRHVFPTNGVYNPGSGSYWAFTNDWSLAATLRPGIDYQESIGVLPPAVASGAVISGTYPAASPGQLYGYPEIVFGGQGGNAVPPGLTVPISQKINQYNNITSTFSVTPSGGNRPNFDVLTEMWLNTAVGSSGHNEFELYVLLAPSGTQGVNYPFGAPVAYQITSPFRADVTIRKPGDPGWGQSWTFLQFYPVTAFNNQFINPTLSGSAPGTPGTPPTNTSPAQSGPALTSSIVGSGMTTAGDGTTVNYVDVRFNGTTAAAGNLQFTFGWNTGVTATAGSWSACDAYVAITNNVDPANVNSYSMAVNGFNGGAFVGAATSPLLLTSTTLQRYFLSYLASATVNDVNCEVDVSVAASAAIDITIRYANPRLGPDPTTTMLSGTIDWLALNNALIAKGTTTGNEFTNGLELGIESAGGSQSLTINNFSVLWN